MSQQQTTATIVRRRVGHGLLRGWRRRAIWILATSAPWTGCAGLPESGRQQLLAAYGRYRDKDFQGARAVLDVYLDVYPARHESAEAYYLRALCHAQTSQRDRATGDARSCIRYAREPDLRTKAHAMAGSLLFEAGNTSEALRHYAAAMRMPERPPKDLLRFRYGVCLQREGRWRQARLEFAAVFQRYPDSNLAGRARRAYDWPHDYFSIQCGAFRDKAGGRELVDKLKRGGMKVRLETRPRRGEMLYMVYSGRYPMYEQAQTALRRAQRPIPDAVIVP